MTAFAGNFNTNGNLAAQSQAFGLVPTGTIMPYVGSMGGFAPNGWRFCDGTPFSTTAAPGLFAVIGYSYGQPSSGIFNVPDFRGRFLRGVAGPNTGVYGTSNQGDPDAGARGQSSTGSNGGNAPGSIQNDSLQAHIFGTINGVIGVNSGPGGSGTPNVSSVLACGLTNTNSGATPSGYSQKRDAVGSYGFNGAWGNDMILYPIPWNGPPGNSRNVQLAVETRVINVSVNYIIKL